MRTSPGPVAVDPNRKVDRLSASYLIALGARVVREVGDLVRRASEAGKRKAPNTAGPDSCAPCGSISRISAANARLQ